MVGLQYNETIGKGIFWFTFVGVNSVFPQHFLGLSGMPAALHRTYPRVRRLNLVSSLRLPYIFRLGVLICILRA